MESNLKRNGFTLIELVIVIAIIGILTAIALPKFIDMSGAAKAASTKAGLGAVRSTLAIRYAASATAGAVPTFPGSLATSDFAGGAVQNAVSGLNGVTALTETEAGTATSTDAGFWYISGPTNSANYGKAGAYSDGTINTSAY